VEVAVSDPDDALNAGGTRQLDMDTLRAFVALADLGGLAQAGRRIGRTEAAISQQLKRLEERAGQELVTRQGRRLRLTDAGERLLGYARRILALNDEALAAVQGTDLSGQVRFGTSQDFGEAWLPPVLAQFRRAYPSICLEVRVDGGTRSVQAVEAGELDFALALGLGERGRCRTIGRLPLVWIAHEDFEWDRRAPLPLAVFTAPCRFRNRGVAALDAIGIPWSIALTSPGLHGVWTAVKAGLGVTIRTPQGLLPGLQIVNGKFGLPDLGDVDVSLYFRDSTCSPAVESLAQMLTERLSGRIQDLDVRRRQLTASATPGEERSAREATMPASVLS
jgi:DNA-binding transcriptional LysR family regulator